MEVAVGHGRVEVAGIADAVTGGPTIDRRSGQHFTEVLLVVANEQAVGHHWAVVRAVQVAVVVNVGAVAACRVRVAYGVDAVRRGLAVVAVVGRAGRSYRRADVRLEGAGVQAVDEARTAEATRQYEGRGL